MPRGLGGIKTPSNGPRSYTSGCLGRKFRPGYDLRYNGGVYGMTSGGETKMKQKQEQKQKSEAQNGRSQREKKQQIDKRSGVDAVLCNTAYNTNY